MFSIVFDVFTEKDNIKLEGFVWMMVFKDSSGWIKTEITSPYSGIGTSASICNEKVDFMGNTIDPLEISPAGVMLKYLYIVCKSFEDNIDQIRERNHFYNSTDEYEVYAVYDDLRRNYENKIKEIDDDFENGVISEMPHEYEDWIMESEKCYYKIENYRFPLIDEIPVICGIEMDEEIILGLIDKYLIS